MNAWMIQIPLWNSTFLCERLLQSQQFPLQNIPIFLLSWKTKATWTLVPCSSYLYIFLLYAFLWCDKTWPNLASLLPRGLSTLAGKTYSICSYRTPHFLIHILFLSHPEMRASFSPRFQACTPVCLLYSNAEGVRVGSELKHGPDMGLWDWRQVTLARPAR